MVYYIGLCLPKSQNVQRIILDRWLRKPLPILYILSLKVISRVVSLLSLLFSPDHFLRLTGVFPPGCALKISAKEKEGACSTTRATLQPTPRQFWTFPCLQDPCGVSQAENSTQKWKHTENSPQPATESSSCLLLPSDSITPLIRLCGCLFSAEWISSCSWDSHSTSLHLQSDAWKGMLQIPRSWLWIMSLLVSCQTSGRLYK